MQQEEWLAEIGGLGYNISPVMDREYFHSIYYREPGGILFEIATDSPGFAIDEASRKDSAKRCSLPPWLETHASTHRSRAAAHSASPTQAGSYAQ